MSSMCCLLTYGLSIGLLINLSSSQVIGFDFGSTFFKITMVTPGQPFDIVENTVSKRKTESMLSFTEEGRLFGIDSFTEQYKYPTSTFTNLQQYINEPYSESISAYLKDQKFVFNEIVEDERGLIAWQVKPSEGNKNQEFLYTEELIAMILKYGRHLSEIQAGTIVKDCVITIPSYFEMTQKMMMLDAAELAGLEVIQLVHENVAAAITFGINRVDFDQPANFLFYNMGGTDTEVLIVKYSTIIDKLSNKPFEHIEILSESWDKELGGNDLDLVLVNMLADNFNNLPENKGKADIRTNQKAIKKIYKEAIKAKEILSANKFTQVRICELQDYVTLYTTIERQEFEHQAQKVFNKILKPVEDALQKAGLTLDDIDMIELIGGGIRVPKVQQILQQQLNNRELGIHLNGDEAMSFGSALIAANYSQSHKVRKIYLTQHPQHQINIEINAIDNLQQQDNDDSCQLKDVFFKRSDYLGQTKLMSLHCNRSIQIKIFQNKDNKQELLLTYYLNDITSILNSNAIGINHQVQLQFELDLSGLIQLNDVSISYQDYEVAKSVDDSVESKPQEPILISKTIQCTSMIKVVYEGNQILTKKQYEAAKQRMLNYDRIDETKEKTDIAKNDLESVVYELRDWINEEENIAFVGYQRYDTLIFKLMEIEDWLIDGDGNMASYQEYDKKHQDLNSQLTQFKMRKEEYLKREEAIEQAQQSLTQVDQELQNLLTQNDWLAEYSEEFKVNLGQVKQWLTEIIDKQNQTPLDEDPAFKIELITQTINTLLENFQLLKQVPKPEIQQTIENSETIQEVSKDNDQKVDIKEEISKDSIKNKLKNNGINNRKEQFYQN